MAAVKGSKSITVWERNALDQRMRKHSVDLLVPKLMYVLSPEQMLALIKLHDIEVKGPNVVVLKDYPRKEVVKKKKR